MKKLIPKVKYGKTDHILVKNLLEYIKEMKKTDEGRLMIDSIYSPPRKFKYVFANKDRKNEKFKIKLDEDRKEEITVYWWDKGNPVLGISKYFYRGKHVTSTIWNTMENVTVIDYEEGKFNCARHNDILAELENGKMKYTKEDKWGEIDKYEIEYDKIKDYF